MEDSPTTPPNVIKISPERWRRHGMRRRLGERTIGNPIVLLDAQRQSLTDSQQFDTYELLRGTLQAMIEATVDNTHIAAVEKYMRQLQEEPSAQLTTQATAYIINNNLGKYFPFVRKF